MPSFTLADRALDPIADKVARGERLSREDGIALYASYDLLGIGQLADFARKRINGDRVYFMVNRHINPTNVCRNRCKFCAFARSAGEEGAYEMTLDTVAEAAAEGAADGAYEIHIVSGLHPDWDYEFYLDMVRRTRDAVPDHVIVQAFTAVEIEHMAVDHLIRLREQQDKTGGFLAFIPLAFHPANTELSDLPSTTGFDDLKTLAISRLMLDNIPHVKSFWIMVGLKVAQISTFFGVDDIDGTVVEERITHMAGATTPEALSKDDLVAMIAETGHVAVERDTLYRVVRSYAEEAEGPSWNAGPIGSPPTAGVACGTVATGS